MLTAKESEEIAEALSSDGIAAPPSNVERALSL